LFRSVAHGCCIAIAGCQYHLLLASLTCPRPMGSALCPVFWLILYVICCRSIGICTNGRCDSFDLQTSLRSWLWKAVGLSWNVKWGAVVGRQFAEEIRSGLESVLWSKRPNGTISSGSALLSPVQLLVVSQCGDNWIYWF
jgi:hypothetical protein